MMTDAVGEREGKKREDEATGDRLHVCRIVWWANEQSDGGK